MQNSFKKTESIPDLHILLSQLFTTPQMILSVFTTLHMILMGVSAVFDFTKGEIISPVTQAI